MVTKIFCKLDEKGNLKSIIIEGHANFAKKGQDIVCAAISAITNGTINFLQKYYSTNCQIICLPAKINIYLLNDNPDCQLVLKLMFYQLKNVANSFPNYLEIEKE